MKRYVEHVRVSFVIQEQKKGVSTPLDSHSDLHQLALDEQRTSRMWTYIYFSIRGFNILARQTPGIISQRRPCYVLHTTRYLHVPTT